MTGDVAQAFWDFSLEVYGAPGVADSCLRLQDRLGIDVNLLLFACWVGAAGGGRPKTDAWRALIRQTAGWRREVVEPLRAVRQRLKAATWPSVRPDAASSLRTAVKKLELEAERIQQMAIAGLFHIVPDPAPGRAARAADAAANVEGYLCALEVAAGPADRADVALIVAAACGKM